MSTELEGNLSLSHFEVFFFLLVIENMDPRCHALRFGMWIARAVLPRTAISRNSNNVHAVSTP